MDDKLPANTDSPSKPPWAGGIDTHIIEVKYHDVHDICIDRQYTILFLDDADNGRFIASNYSFPVTTEKEL
jgi:hypothetical protein